jgi:LuxR family transcriptional regulator, activator of conjugal transfer of Ti plasmids
MHRIFQTFIDSLAESTDVGALRSGMTEAALALELNCFAYLSLPDQPNTKPQHITTYPPNWTAHYLRNHYERLDPVIAEALISPEPFDWGLEIRSGRLSRSQQQLFDEAAGFGIRCGFTIPIHDGRGPIAAVTFAADEPRSVAFRRRIEEQRRVLQLMAIYFHAHARRKLTPDRVVNGVTLSPRELECLEWAAQGKTAWETARIIGISRHTVATYLDNAKAKLDVRTIVQAVARLTASKSIV